MRKIKLRVMRLAHAADLPLPAYQSAGAVGLDLMAAVPAGAPLVIAPGGRAAVPTGLAFAPSWGRGPDQAALRARAAVRRDGAQLTRHARSRLPR